MAAEAGQTGADAAEAPLVLKPKLDLKGSVDLARELRARRGANLEIDASNVDHLGTHAVQTLLVAVRSWQSDGRQLTVRDLSVSAAEQLAVMGLDESIFDGERTEG